MFKITKYPFFILFLLILSCSKKTDQQKMLNQEFSELSQKYFEFLKNNDFEGLVSITSQDCMKETAEILRFIAINKEILIDYYNELLGNYSYEDILSKNDIDLFRIYLKNLISENGKGFDDRVNLEYICSLPKAENLGYIVFKVSSDFGQDLLPHNINRIIAVSKESGIWKLETIETYQLALKLNYKIIESNLYKAKIKKSKLNKE